MLNLVLGFVLGVCVAHFGFARIGASLEVATDSAQRLVSTVVR